jgi:LPS sulfotransferase NodH
MHGAARSSRPVFIVGSPRSGTTWLYHILLSAGRFAIYRSETQLYNSFAPRYGNLASARRREAFLRKWLASEYFLRSGLDSEDFFVKAQHASSPGKLLRLFMEEICAYQHAARWAECTPEYSLHIERIRQDFPEALFLHIVRDGRDVALSLAKQGFVRPLPWHSNSPEIAAAVYWRYVVNAVRRQTCTFPGDVLTVTYEDLVSGLDAALRRIAEFIDQDLDPKRVRLAAIGAVANPNSSYAAPVAGDGRYAARWRSGYSDASLARIENLIGDALDRYGYARETRGARSARNAAVIALYESRFRVGRALKLHTFLGRYAGDGLGRLSPDNAAHDPTLRPREHLAQIRRIVEGQG